MGRLIDADAIIDFIDMGHYRNPLETCFSERDVVDMLESTQTLDAVPVVRCRDCRFYTPVDNRIGKCVFLIGEHQYVVKNGYCYLGERKDGAGIG